MFRVNLHMNSNLPIFLPRFRWGHRTLWHRFKREKMSNKRILCAVKADLLFHYVQSLQSTLRQGSPQYEPQGLHDGKIISHYP